MRTNFEIIGELAEAYKNYNVINNNLECFASKYFYYLEEKDILHEKIKKLSKELANVISNENSAAGTTEQNDPITGE